MRIIDTHLHLIYLDRLSYPWLTRFPDLNRQWDAPLYFAEAETLGIDTALHMEVDVARKDMEAETELVLNLDKRIKGAIAAAHPEDADFPAQLERLAAEPRVKGIRRLIQAEPDTFFTNERFNANLPRIVQHGLTFDLCVLDRQLPLTIELVRRHPNVQFVLDHCGNPLIGSGDIAQWRIDIAALAKLPNVVGKISGIVNHALPNWKNEDLRPVIEHMIASFGWDRVLWGSDRPVCVPNAGLTRWVEATKAAVSGASQSEQEKLFSKNAERIYRV
jgi:predicted TIM-barrel fold metal-dependent hydrolase